MVEGIDTAWKERIISILTREGVSLPRLSIWSPLLKTFVFGCFGISYLIVIGPMSAWASLQLCVKAMAVIGEPLDLTRGPIHFTSTTQVAALFGSFGTACLLIEGLLIWKVVPTMNTIGADGARWLFGSNPIKEIRQARRRQFYSYARSNLTKP